MITRLAYIYRNFLTIDIIYTVPNFTVNLHLFKSNYFKSLIAMGAKKNFQGAILSAQGDKDTKKCLKTPKRQLQLIKDP